MPANQTKLLFMNKWFLVTASLLFLQCPAQKTNNRILVISGGGSRGAWGAGFANYLSDSFGVYNVAFGTSTGSLMSPLILLGDFDRLQRAYTTVTQDKIFDVNPFKENGELRSGNALLRVLGGKKTLGESRNLRNLIDEFVKEDDYKKIRQSKVLGVAVVDLRTGEKFLKCSTDIDSLNDMKDWIWASSNEPVLMTYYYHSHKNPSDKGYYVDAGIQETVPVAEALLFALDHNELKNIDVIVNRPKLATLKKEHRINSILDGTLRMMDIWRTKTEVVSYDVLLATQASEAERNSGDTIHVSLHHLPYKLFLENLHGLLFDPVKMTHLWNEGLKGLEDDAEIISKPNEMTIGRNTLAKYFQQEKEVRLRELSSQTN